MYYEDGVVVAKNLPKALEYYDKAMKLGDFDAKDSFNNLQDKLHLKRNRPAYTVEWQDVLTDTEKLQFKKVPRYKKSRSCSYDQIFEC